jgi:hypothetical protein
VSERFARVGLTYRFAPSEVPVVLSFSRPADHRDELTFEVAVHRPDGKRVLTRRVNILGSSTRGSIKELIDELAAEVNGPDWKRLLREVCESVLVSHRGGPPVVDVGGSTYRPPDPPWLCDGLLLKNKPNVWLGAASTGKSTLAKAICAYYASGYRFLGRAMEQGLPLYLDWEDDEDGFRRVVHDVCRNLGLSTLPQMLWRDMHGYRLRDQMEGVARLVDNRHVGLVVLDAIAAAGGSPGEHMSWEGIALELEQCLGQLSAVTVLGLDHVTGAEHQDNGRVPIKARGAERKLEFTRNQWTLMADQEALQHQNRHLVSWTHTKFNSGRHQKPFVTEICYREAEISIQLRTLEASPEAVDRLSDTDKILRFLEATPGQTAAEIAWGVFGLSTRNKVESTRVLLKRAQQRELCWMDESTRWWCKHPSRNGFRQTELEDPEQ